MLIQETLRRDREYGNGGATDRRPVEIKNSKAHFHDTVNLLEISSNPEPNKTSAHVSEQQNIQFFGLQPTLPNAFENECIAEVVDEGEEEVFPIPILQTTTVSNANGGTQSILGNIISLLSSYTVSEQITPSPCGRSGI
eukprot:gb/GEZJ01002482.1/.p1 GENE.gb/GEZJ01002482.1/~~gb/GEZJ01002482.1/.p1  ORF type:complete len:139 (+),score=11.81 gb/GEZJ01002482.1/:482-898(+)